jgi:hypothetical protein
VKGSQVTVKGSQVTVKGSQATVRQLRRAFAAHLPKNLTAAQRAAVLRKFDAATSHGGRIVVNPATGAPLARIALTPGMIAPPALRAAEGLGLPGAAGPTVLGKDWLTVVVIPANGLAATGFQAGGGTAYRSHLTVRMHAGPVTSQEVLRTQAPAGTPHAVVVPGGPDLAVLGALLRSAKPVHGTWGSGRLLTTTLVSALITSNGKILIGAVTPSVLYADAAQVK